MIKHSRFVDTFYDNMQSVSIAIKEEMVCLQRLPVRNFSAETDNDDDAERMERRRNAEMEMRQRDTTPPISEYIKINTKNAFSLQLIDYMAMMLKKRDSKMDNFQVASCTLDASTKIYAYRVDCVHTDVLKMAGGLAAGARKKNAEAGDEEIDPEADENADNSAPSHRKKKSRKHKNTIAANVGTLNAKADIQHAMDPFFLRSTGNMGDCQPGDCHFLSSLDVLSNSALLLSSDVSYWNVEDNLSVEDIDVVPPPIPDLTNKAICPEFAQFSFTSWSLDRDEEETDVFMPPPPILQDADDDFAFDVNAVPEPVPACETETPLDTFEVGGIDEGIDSDGEDLAGPIACAMTQRTPAARVVDLRKHLSAAPSEYSYFRAGALDLWAGPSHWKIRPIRSTAIGGIYADSAADGTEASADNKKQKQKQKKELIVDFLSESYDIQTIEQSNPTLKLTKRTLQKVWSAEKNTHPPDIHYDIKKFSQLTMRRLTAVSLDPEPVEDDQPSGYDYNNDHDTSEYCPNVALADDMDDADDGGGDDGFLASQQDVHNSLMVEGTMQTDAFMGDNLVAPPSKFLHMNELPICVARIFIPYAMRAKKVDMKKLKGAIWSILTDADARKDVSNPEELKVEKAVSFRDMYNKLPLKLSSKLAENLSAPLAIVALLHLANEKILLIKGKDDLSDLTITQA
ncbi:Condensin complex subunit 2 [Blattella germanica]|nr:Condensin complex subunit 2 [Blattella germanica]